MIKQKINKLKKQIELANENSGRYFGVAHFVNEDYYESDGVRYKTLEEFNKANNITKHDDVMIFHWEWV